MDYLTSDVVSQWVSHCLPDIAVGMLVVGTMLVGLTWIIRWGSKAARGGERE